MVLRNLVKREQVKEIKTEDSIFSLRFSNNAVEFIVVAAEDANVALKFLNILLFYGEEGSEFVNLT